MPHSQSDLLRPDSSLSFSLIVRILLNYIIFVFIIYSLVSVNFVEFCVIVRKRKARDGWILLHTFGNIFFSSSFFHKTWFLKTKNTSLWKRLKKFKISKETQFIQQSQQAKFWKGFYLKVDTTKVKFIETNKTNGISMFYKVQQ